jgi:AraC family transcriptional regulator of adaptative response / DNA-3-methyladenine glycosylase II
MSENGETGERHGRIMPPMLLDPESCYRALATHDPRFDGRMFVGVASTGVYCRPVCPARRPRRENCRFYVSAAAAERDGFRPCLRCRPELAPGNASVDAQARLAQAAASLIEDGLANDVGLDAIAARLSVTDRHLRRVFQAEFGVTPVEYAQTQRLLLAKRLLTDSALPVTHVAFAAGFGSLRRFNALFGERYRVSPTGLRKHVRAAAATGSLDFELAYRPPLDWSALLAFLSARAIAGVESIDSDRYRRTVCIEHRGRVHAGWVEVRQAPRQKPALAVRLAPALSTAIPQALARVKHLFDLACDPQAVAERLGPLAAGRPGLRVPGAFSGFEVAVRAVLGQQITVKAARTLAGRIAARFGTALETPFADVGIAFPDEHRIARATPSEIGELGILRSRVRAIQALAQALASGALRLEPLVDVEETIAKLRALPGFGEWTAQYIAMRALAWPDAFPQADFGVLKALRETDPRRALGRAEDWRPWRAYAVMHLWSSLDQPPPPSNPRPQAPRDGSARLSAKSKTKLR